MARNLYVDMNIKQARRIVSEGYLSDVVKLLEALGSSQDPIRHGGKDTTPEELMYSLGWDTKATDLRISFYASDKKGRLCHKKGSTFAQMLCDRANMEVNRRIQQNEHTDKTVVEYIVAWDEWDGMDPCGRTEWQTHSKKFKNKAEARKFYDAMAAQHPARFKKTTVETLALN